MAIFADFLGQLYDFACESRLTFNLEFQQSDSLFFAMTFRHTEF